MFVPFSGGATLRTPKRTQGAKKKEHKGDDDQRAAQNETPRAHTSTGTHTRRTPDTKTQRATGQKRDTTSHKMATRFLLYTCKGVCVCVFSLVVVKTVVVVVFHLDLHTFGCVLMLTVLLLLLLLFL